MSPYGCLSHNTSLYYKAIWFNLLGLEWAPICPQCGLICMCRLMNCLKCHVWTWLEGPLCLKAIRLLEESLASVTTWGGDHPLVLFKVQLGHLDTHKWHADLKTTWGRDHPMALLRVQLEHLDTNKWRGNLKTTWGGDHPLALFKVELRHSDTHKWREEDLKTTLQIWIKLRPFGLVGRPIRPKVVQEKGNGLVAKFCVLTDPSFSALLFFSYLSLSLTLFLEIGEPSLV